MTRVVEFKFLRLIHYPKASLSSEEDPNLTFCMKRYLLLFACSIFASLGMYGQVTTSTIRGTVTDASGQPLPGATVTALHQPSGTTYGVVTRLDGSYHIPNVRIGGPYKVEASFTGFQAFTADNIYSMVREEF